MFELKNYINFEDAEYNICDKTIKIPICSLDKEKISEEATKLRNDLLNLRKMIGKDYALVVIGDKIKIMKEE